MINEYNINYGNADQRKKEIEKLIKEKKEQLINCSSSARKKDLEKWLNTYSLLLQHHICPNDGAPSKILS
jgi:hypothetical protein